MRAALIAALVAAAAAAPAPSPDVTLTEVVDVYTTVYEDDSAAPSNPPARASGVWWQQQYRASRVAAAPSVVPQLQKVSTAPQPAIAVPASVPVAAAPAASSASSSYGSSGGKATPAGYSDAVVAHHNAHRANHSASALVWDAALAATAQKIATSCVYAHDTKTDGGGYGQNIAAGAPANNISSVITELFYNNEVGNFQSLYGQSTPSNINDETAFDGWGHFTQIVWKATTKVGCATVDCSSRGLKNTGSNVPAYFTVCNYGPAGNFLGEFAKNVVKPNGYASINWAST